MQQMGGALRALNKDGVKRVFWRIATKKLFTGGWKDQIKSLCADIFTRQTPGDIPLLLLVTAYGHRITY